MDQQVHLKRIEMAQRYADHLSQKRRSESGDIGAASTASSTAQRMCWLCGAEVGTVIYNSRDLCLDCGEDVMNFGLLPLLASVLASVDAMLEARLSDVEQTAQLMSPLSSPIAAPAAHPFSGWTCYHCKSIVPSAADTCTCCKRRRPLELVCPRCSRHAEQHKVCAVTRHPHVLWPCAECSSTNIDDAVQCRVCQRKRTWFCAACSLENAWANRQCDACDGSNKVATLSTLVNRDFLHHLGFESDAQKLQNEQRKKVESSKEHTARLERRIEQLQLFPIPIDDDGNCLFRALSYQLVRTDAFHMVVRHMIVDYMEQHRTEYCLLVGADDFDAYISGMRRNSIWGDELCVHAASRAFNMKIHVVTSDEARWHLRYEPQVGRSFAADPEAPPKRQLFLCYRSPDHYYCVVNAAVEPRVRLIDLDAALRLWGQGSAFPLPQQQAVAPQQKLVVEKLPPASSSSAPAQLGIAHVVLSSNDARGKETVSPPRVRRGAPDSTTTNHQPLTQAHAGRLPTTTSSLPQPLSTPAAVPVQSAERPLTRSLRNEVLQFSHFAFLPHPVMVRLCVAASQNNIGVDTQERVRQDKEGAYFYLYTIPHKMILDGGEARFPWGPLYRQTQQLHIEYRQKPGAALMPLFLLQHIQTGGFITPADDLSLRSVFADLSPVHCADLHCRRVSQLSASLLTIDDNSTQSRSKLYLRFFQKELKAPFIGFVGEGRLFCCEFPVANSMLVVHQLFSGRAERLCLRCRQWYDGGKARPLWHAQQEEDAATPSAKESVCQHFSWVEETLELLDRV